VSAESRYRAAADAMAARLRLFKGMRLEAESCGREVMELKPVEFFEAKDLEVLAEYEDAKAALTGARPLLLEVD
jgi:hypothetical protein